MSRVELEVELEEGVTGVIFIGTRDDPRVLAEDFVRAYSLGAAAVGPLSACILEKQRKLVDNVRQAREANAARRGTTPAPTPTPSPTPIITKMAKNLQRVPAQQRFEMLSDIGSGKIRSLTPQKQSVQHNRPAWGAGTPVGALPRTRTRTPPRTARTPPRHALDELRDAANESLHPFEWHLGGTRRASSLTPKGSQNAPQNAAPINPKEKSVRAGERLYRRAQENRRRLDAEKKRSDAEREAEEMAECRDPVQTAHESKRRLVPLGDLPQRASTLMKTEDMAFEEHFSGMPSVPHARRLHSTNGGDVYSSLYDDAESREGRRQHAAELQAVVPPPRNAVNSAMRAKPQFHLDSGSSRVFDRLSRCN